MPIQPPSKDNIKVGYISKTGYVKGLTIEEANNYEKLSPKTTFIFIDGDNEVRYLSIDEVNDLTINDLKRSNPCDVSPKKCGPPTLNFYGGEGIGAKANPIVDAQGNLIAADLVNRGYGYKTPPKVQVIDPCNNGNGAVLETELLYKNGKNTGRVLRVIVRDSGTGYLPPGQTVPQYPALIKLSDVIVKNPGINYNCGVDQLVVVPNNGTSLSYNCDPFGKIKSVKVNTGGNFTSLPTIFMDSETGVNADFTPVFDVVRDPLVAEEVDPGQVVQVFDLVGLQINGYVGGDPYYGNVFFENGVKYAGTRNTGVRVYNTRAESIGAEATITPGTDIVATFVPQTTTDIASTPTVDTTAAPASTPTPAPAPTPAAPPPPPPSVTPAAPPPPPPAAPPPPPPAAPPPPPSGGGGYGGY